MMDTSKVEERPWHAIVRHRVWRWLFILAIATTILNSVIAYFFGSRYAGGFNGFLLCLGVILPQASLMLGTFGTRKKPSMWIRFSAWVLSSMVLFLPQLILFISFLPGWIWQHIDVTKRPANVHAFIESVANSMILLTVFCFPLWPISEVASSWTNFFTHGSAKSHPPISSQSKTLSVAAYFFTAFQAFLGAILLIRASGFRPNLDHIPSWVNTHLTYPLFTISITHFLIAYAVMYRSRFGIVAILINILAWGGLILFNLQSDFRWIL